ncbi:MAG TPA: endolytic transglycosylase MltG, partial [Paenibacillaceae bacterium]|nr:endolytic transglycosylase MltG [Paenibacillaceae bacterium]
MLYNVLYGDQGGLVVEKKKKIYLLLISVLVVLFIPMIYFLFSLQGVHAKSGEQRIVAIPSNTSTQKIGEILKKESLIRNSFTFMLYAKITGKGNELKAGKYQFTYGQSAGEIMDQIAQGKVYKDSFTLIIPEGFTVAQIAQRLDTNGIVKKEDFLKEADHGVFAYDFVKAIPADKKIKHPLEGYLFPDTYEVEKGTTSHEIIDMLLKRHQEIWQPEWDVKLKSLHLTRHEFMTLASIIEREVKVKKEQSIIAGIYLNRLKIDMPLQADATIQYVFKNQKDRITYEDLKINDPYNTYMIPGFTPGPISNP